MGKKPGSKGPGGSRPLIEPFGRPRAPGENAIDIDSGESADWIQKVHHMKAMDQPAVRALHDAIRHTHGCDSRFIEWQHVADTFRGELVFERDVAVFAILGHPKASRAYAWAEPGTSSPTAIRFFAVLQVPPIDDALKAVRASIVADRRQR